MLDMADRRIRTVHPGADMRPRRWYSEEVAPPHRQAVKLTSELWRYRSLVRRRKHDAAPSKRGGVTTLGKTSTYRWYPRDLSMQSLGINAIVGAKHLHY